ncbi:MAG: hypothetical protein FJW31_01465 [Acidobacteria bacterium]|nr:hypothetical protein [Acidobacteriota bacterium]
MSTAKRYNLLINPVGLTGAAAQAYTHNVEKHLSWIDGTKVGRLLLKATGWHARNNPGNLVGGSMPIQPYTGGGCNAVVNNATSGPNGWSQPTVTYSPNVFNHGGACHADLKKSSTNRGLYPDELLFHELVHGFRGGSGRFRASTTNGGLVRYTGTEEFIAVLTTNIYISDPSDGSKTGLRRDHQGFTPLEKGFAGPFEFFRSSKNASTLIDQFCRENPSFTKWVSEVKAPFNPIAAYYSDQAKAKKYSEGAVALVRDGEWVELLGKLATGKINL